MAQILIVEDDPMQALIVRMITEQLGHTGRIAEHGAAALAMCAVERPDLVLLDIKLPGLDGYAVCRHLKQQENTRRTPVVMLTASTDPGLNRRAYEVGAAACILKPATLANIRGILNVLLKSSPPPRSPETMRHPQS
jgi:putative two-component system response regulator